MIDSSEWARIEQFIRQRTEPIDTLIRQLQGQLGGVLVRSGKLAPVTSDGGGWCNYTITPAFPTAIRAVVAVNDWLGGSGAAFQVVQAVDAGHFRAFVAAAGLNCSCAYIATGK